MEEFECGFCKKTFSLDPCSPFCPTCQEPLLHKTPLTEKTFHLEKEHPLESFLDFLPLDRVNRGLSLGEGRTPLIRLKNTEERFQLPSLFAKNETINPTGSFKDRGTAVAIQKAVSLGFKSIGTVSTGNMAASTAAYGARAGLKTVLLVKHDVHEDILASISVHSPLQIKVKGDYGDLFWKSFSLGKKNDIYFMNSVDPFRIEGYKVTAFEIYLQLNRQSPEFLIAPVSSGGHLIGLIKGFQELKQEGWIPKTPRFIGVQAEGCSPIAQTFQAGRIKVERIKKGNTIAHGISNPDPPGGHLLLRLLKKEQGMVVSVPDEDILAAQAALAEREGLFVQPASATPLAGMLKLAKKEPIKDDTRIVLLLTGRGKKAAFPSPATGKSHIIPSDLSQLEKTLRSALHDKNIHRE